MTDPAPQATLDDLLAHRRWVRSLARRLAADESAADDLEQEAWLAALRHPPRRSNSLRGWLGTIVRNMARTAGRRSGRRERHETAAAGPAETPRPDDVVAEAEVQTRLVQAVLALDEPYRSTVLLRFFHGLEATEIAARLGAPVETVRTRLKRGIERLRERMGEELGDDRDAWCLLVLGRRSAPSTGGSAITAAAGGVAMGAATKIAVGAAVLLAAAGVWWTWGRTEDDAAAERTRAAAAATAAAANESTKAPRRATADGSADVATTPAGAVPSPVDLAKTDRDLDVFGLVVRKDGSPVAGARIQTVAYPWRRTFTLYGDGVGEPVLGAVTTSATDGTFSVRLRRGELVSLRLTKDGLAPLELPDRQSGERVRAVMEPGVTLVVAVKDEAGAPVGGVRVHLDRRFRADPWIDTSGVTGADGFARFADLPGECRVDVEPESPLGIIADARVELPAVGEARCDLVLRPGRTIRGRVIDADTGAAIAGARIGVGWNLQQAVASQADGTYALAGCPDRPRETIEVVADGYARAVEAAGSRERIDFALRRGFTARGRILGPDGAPVAGACVSFVATRHDAGVQMNSLGHARVGADGRFVVGSLDRTMVHVLTVVAPGAGRLRRPIESPAAGSDELDLGDVTLPSPRVIEGRVTDAKGEPVARRSVELDGPLLDAPLAGHYGRTERRATDDLGRFRFPDLAPGRYRVGSQERGAPEIVVEVELPSYHDLLDVVLGPPRMRDVVVRVADDAAKPVAGVDIALFGGPGNPANGTTDAAGTVRFAADERRLRVVVFPPSAAGRTFLMPDPRFLPARGARELSIVLREGAVVAGVVLDPDGKPVAEAWLRVERDGETVCVERTDAAGRFDAVVPRGAPLAFVVSGSGTRELLPADLLVEGRADGVAPGAADVTIRCTRVELGRTLSIVVTAPDGTPVAGAPVLIGGKYGGSPAPVVTGADGRAAWSDLPSRKLRVVISAKDGLLGPPPVEVIATGQELAVTMRAAARVTGSVVDSDGSPVANARVLVHEGSDVASWADADAAGAFTVLVPAARGATFTLEATDPSPDQVFGGEVRGVTAGQTGVRIVVDR